MIKIRLHGLPEEIKKAKDSLKDNFKILNCSEPYKDRGKSSYERVYIDAEIKTIEEKLKEILSGFQLILKNKDENEIKVLDGNFIIGGIHTEQGFFVFSGSNHVKTGVIKDDLIHLLDAIYKTTDLLIKSKKIN